MMQVDLTSMLGTAEKIATIIDDFMLDELHLAAPAAYELSARAGKVFLVGSYNPLVMGKSLRVYEHPEVARRLRLALGLPVIITRETGTRYVVLLQGQVALPKSVDFPIENAERDVFRLGIGLKGEIRVPAHRLGNVMIGAGQGQGKSNILELLTWQMKVFGWSLYLADPQYHTFNPDIWNSLAVVSVAGSHADMLQLLDRLEGEIANRVERFRRMAMGGRIPADIDEYNQLAVRTGMDPMPRIGLVSDESNFFLGNKVIFNRLADLLRQGRKWGLHIVVAAHEWHKETIPAAVNDLLQTRIALASLSGAVVLRSAQWGKWVERRPPGRGVLRMSNYQPIQFYRMANDWTRAGQLQGLPVLPEREADLVRRSLSEAGGKMTMGLLMQWGMSEPEARELGARYAARGWLAKDPRRDNARFVTEELVRLVESAPNHQTDQTVQTTVDVLQTGLQTAQTEI